MQLPSIDRTPNMRPAGADLASSGANRVIPVAPVNPSVHVSPTSNAQGIPVSPGSPSVINLINPALKPNEGEPVHTSVSDPSRRGSEAATAQKDWTIHRPEAAKVENPPPKPLYQMLMDHIKQMWTAGASAIQIEQVSKQLTPPVPVAPTDAPGTYAKEVLVYSPNTINKPGKIG